MDRIVLHMFLKRIDEDLSLALIQPSFAKNYFKIVKQQSTYLGEWLPWVAKADNEGYFLEFINKALHDYADGRSMVFTILYHQQVVGNISFNFIDLRCKKADIGYWLHQDYQKLGIIHRSVCFLIDIARNELPIQLIEIRVAEGNLPSRKVAERLGFRLDGILRNAETINNKIVNHALYSYDLT